MLQLFTVGWFVACGPGSGQATSPFVFVEAFEATTNLDAAATTATWDAAGQRMVGTVFELADAGSGADGAVETVADADWAGGTLDLTAGAVNHNVDVADDLTLRVQGPLTLGPDGILEVRGSLVLVVGGPLRVAGEIYVEGDLVVMQPTDAGIEIVDGGEVFVERGQSITVATRGDVSLRSTYVQAGGASSDGTPGGDLVLWAYGDVSLADEAEVESDGRLDLRTEGSLELGGESGLVGNRSGSEIGVHVAGALTLSGESRIEAEGELDVAVGETMRVEGESSVECGPGDLDGASPCVVGARALTLDTGWIEATWGDDVPGGAVQVDVVDTLTSADGWIRGGRGDEGRGGDVHVRAGGDITLTGFGGISGGGGDSSLGWPGGGVTVEAGGELRVADGAEVRGGEGDPSGEVQIVEGEDPGVRVDPELVQRTVATSIALGVPRAGLVVTAASHEADDAAGPVQVEVSPGPDAAFLLLDGLAGTELEEGWRYRATVPARLFDSSALESVRVEAD